MRTNSFQARMHRRDTLRTIGLACGLCLTLLAALTLAIAAAYLGVYSGHAATVAACEHDPHAFPHCGYILAHPAAALFGGDNIGQRAP